MSVELLQTLSLVAFILGGVLFLVAVALFFLFNVPQLYGEVSGATARKAIENIRQQNEVSGNKAYRPSPVNASRGKLTDKITPSGKLEARGETPAVSVGTSKLKKNNAAAEASQTVLLEADAADASQTVLLEANNAEASQTVLLSADSAAGATTLLSCVDEAVAAPVAAYSNNDLQNNSDACQAVPADFIPTVSAEAVQVEVDISFVGSNEIIE